MGTDLLVHGRDDDDRPASEPSWRLRLDGPARVLALTAAVTAFAGVSTVRAHEPAPRPRPVAVPERAPAATHRSTIGMFVRRTADPTMRAARAVVSADGSFVVSPVEQPSAPAARRAAELVMAAQCTNIERPRYRLIRGSTRGLSATFVVSRSSESPHRNAGFQLRLNWDEGQYVGVVSDAYGGCGGP